MMVVAHACASKTPEPRCPAIIVRATELACYHRIEFTYLSYLLAYVDANPNCQDSRMISSLKICCEQLSSPAGWTQDRRVSKRLNADLEIEVGGLRPPCMLTNTASSWRYACHCQHTQCEQTEFAESAVRLKNQRSAVQIAIPKTHFLPQPIWEVSFDGMIIGGSPPASPNSSSAIHALPLLPRAKSFPLSNSTPPFLTTHLCAVRTSAVLSQAAPTIFPRSLFHISTGGR